MSIGTTRSALIGIRSRLITARNVLRSEFPSVSVRSQHSTRGVERRNCDVALVYLNLERCGRFSFDDNIQWSLTGQAIFTGPWLEYHDAKLIRLVCVE